VHQRGREILVGKQDKIKIMERKGHHEVSALGKGSRPKEKKRKRVSTRQKEANKHPTAKRTRLKQKEGFNRGQKNKLSGREYKKKRTTRPREKKEGSEKPGRRKKR